VSEYLSWSLLVSAVFFAAQVVLSVRVLLRRSPLQNAHAWLLVLWLLPLAGMVLYLLIGENRLGSLRRKQYSDSQRHLAAWANELWLAKEKTWEDGYERFRTLAHLGVTMCDAPAVEGNRLTLHADAGETLDAMIADIDRAESHCHLLTYIFYPEGKPLEVAEALERAVARGVSCRVAVDSAGSRKFFRSGLASRLRSSGVEVLELLGVNPLRLLFRRLDLRNHRKLLIVDGHGRLRGLAQHGRRLVPPQGPRRARARGTTRRRGSRGTRRGPSRCSSSRTGTARPRARSGMSTRTCRRGRRASPTRSPRRCRSSPRAPRAGPARSRQRWCRRCTSPSAN
jgi:hypothetical protein